MKRLLGFILTAVLIFTISCGAFARTLESKEWGIKFDLSENWSADYSNPEVLFYANKSDPSETIAVLYIDLDVDASATVRNSQDLFDAYYDERLSNSTIADELSEANDGIYIRIAEEYQNRRYETYNGIEYYRGEKMYLAQAYGYYDQYFYDTYFVTLCNGRAYIIRYNCADSEAPHFADVTAMLNSMRFADESGSFYRIGDIVGHALKTDIKATINGHQIPSFNVDGYTYIIAEDLRYYGFNVSYDDTSRSLSVTRDFSQNMVSKNYTKPFVSPSQVGEIEHNLLYTDIKTYLDGADTQSYNINGQTIIRFDSLNSYGQINYDNNAREISLTLTGIN